MDVRQTQLLEYFESPDVQFNIPAYQRIYTWQLLQCNELWLDILRAARDDQPHFVGIMLFTHEQQEDSGSDTLSVIDGQQRLTTFTLLLLALARHLEERGAAPSPNVPSPSIIREKFLHLDHKGQAVCRLTLSREDNTTIQAAMKGDAKPASGSDRIFDNLAFFASKMQAPEFDIEKLWKGITKLFVIAIYTEDAEYAQEIFENTNSKGLPLTLADMTRNYLLLEEDTDEQVRLYDEYWAEAESLFEPDPGSLKINSAIKAWLGIRFRNVRLSSPEHVYCSFKQYVEDEFDGTRESILFELRSFCHMWREQYRYHAVKKFRTRDWAVNGASSITSSYKRKESDDGVYKKQVEELEAIDDRY